MFDENYNKHAISQSSSCEQFSVIIRINSSVAQSYCLNSNNRHHSRKSERGSMREKV
jgi:hypothetical protein